MHWQGVDLGLLNNDCKGRLGFEVGLVQDEV